jgi:hypothetical protein
MGSDNLMWWCPEANLIVEKEQREFEYNNKNENKTKEETWVCEKWGKDSKCPETGRTCNKGGHDILEKFDD